ncbi:MAG: carboxylating nicotinate-nucleotide diphosphorylase [Spirochaetia bacterium]|nr:carboxylating nicotinate-nucleotide diphosphorylase [Spirochaetia bacterium]
MQQRHYTQPVSEIHLKDCETLIRLALEEDAPAGDPTSESIFSEIDRGTARAVAKESGILCGMPLVEFILEIFLQITGKTVAFRPIYRDALSFNSGDTLFELEGSYISLLRLERVILNFVQYLSGISTVTAEALKSAPDNVIVLDTRKTLPGYRKLAKYAVFCGGGSNHRIHLSDMAMIKDNHIAASGSLQNAINKILKKKPGLPIEVEVENQDQLETALENNVDVVMLDNMDHENLKHAFALIQKYENPPFIELSGSMTPKKLQEFKEYGHLGISMGYLTHTTRFLDISMDFSKIKSY